MKQVPASPLPADRAHMLTGLETKTPGKNKCSLSCEITDDTLLVAQIHISHTSKEEKEQ